MRTIAILFFTLIFLLPGFQVRGQVAPTPLPHQSPASLDQRDGALRAGSGSSASPMVPGQVLQSGTFAGLSPFGICAIPSTRTICVTELHGGNTYLYNLDQIYAGAIGVILNPGGQVTTTGITSDGVFLYWLIPGAFPNFWRSGLDGSGPQSLGQVIPPALGVVGDITIDGNGDLWVTDVTNDQYSKHSLVDGAYLGVLIPRPAGGGSGNGIAYREACDTLAIPHNAAGSIGVTEISAVNLDGSQVGVTDLPPIGGFFNGIESVGVGSTGVPSHFTREARSSSWRRSTPAPPFPVREPTTTRFAPGQGLFPTRAVPETCPSSRWTAPSPAWISPSVAISSSMMSRST